MASVFIMSCMQYAGNPPRLRTWMEGQRMTRAPEEAAKQYSGGKPSQVYGTRQLGSALFLVSLDDGGCTMIVERAKATTFRNSLEGALANANAVVKVVKDADDSAGRLHNIGYEITNNGASRRWRVVVTTPLVAPTAIELMATAYALPAEGAKQDSSPPTPNP
jgi:hypothetical protein